MADELHYTLLENGLDFIWSAVEHLGAGTEKRVLKYATLHLVAGAELILKEPIRRACWEQLFVDPAKASPKLYDAGAFRSISYEESVERLASVCDIFLGVEELEPFETIRKERHRLQHLAMSGSATAIIPLAAGTLGFVIDFIRDHVGDSTLAENERKLLGRIREKVTDLEGFVNARLESIRPKLAEAYAVLPCPTCLQETLVLDVGVECLFCGYAAEPDEAADAYTQSVMGTSRGRFMQDGGVWPVHWCPGCDGETLAEEGERGYVCFGCGSRWEYGDLEDCGRCGRFVTKGSAVCEPCLREVTSRDD